MILLHPTDFSEDADAAEAQTVRLAHALGGEIVLLHVAAEAPGHAEGLLNTREIEQVYQEQRKWATATLDERVAAIRAHGLAARFILRAGPPADEIVKAARELHADLVVMGTRGRGGIERLFLGSVADRVIRGAPCPVVTVRAPQP